MSLLSNYARKIFGPYLPNIGPERGMKYMYWARMLYFFSATGLAYIVFKDDYKGKPQQADLEKGLPVIEDLSEAHKRIRESGAEYGFIYAWEKGKGMVWTKYKKDEYYRRLEEDALERAKKAQEKLLAEGRELPPGAIKLV